MDTSALSFAFSAVFTPINMLVILGGTILGIFIGAMPGMSSPMGLSIMLPFTFQLHGYAGIMMLLGIFCGSIYGGSISASLLNTPGTIDADYRGEIGIILVNLSSEPFTVNDGERICQMVIAAHSHVDWESVETLDDTERGAGGFGHTGKE